MATWTRVGREPVTALQLDWRRAYCAARKRCFEATGSPLARDHILKVIDGFLYRRAAPLTAEVKERNRRHREQGQRYLDEGTTIYEAEIRPEVEAIVRRLRRHPGQRRPRRVLVEHLEEAVDAYAHVMGDLHWRMAGSVEFDWPSLFAEITGDEPAASATLLGGITNTSTRLVRSLRELARLAQSDDAIRRAVDARDLSLLPDGETFRRAFARLLRRYGLRTGQGFGSTTGWGAPTWNMRPDIPLGIVATYVRADLDALEVAEARARRARVNATRRYRRRLDAGARSGFDAALGLAIAFARQMEDHNHLMDNSVAGILHEAVDLVGRRLVADGVLDEASDVEHLSLEELRALDRVPDVAVTVADRKRVVAELASRPAPPELIGPPSEGPEARFSAEGRGLEGAVLHGVAASGGRYTGRAHVAEASPMPPDVEQGDVLVASDAGPAWTPVFPLLGAIVLDRGAVFQHAAVVAREFGIPAVLGTKDATSVIVHGQTITVDGSHGVVELG